MWETTFARNSHAGFGKPFYEPNILPSMVFGLKVLTKSGVAISRKCCFPHGVRSVAFCHVARLAGIQMQILVETLTGKKTRRALAAMPGSFEFDALFFKTKTRIMTAMRCSLVV